MTRKPTIRIIVWSIPVLLLLIMPRSPVVRIFTVNRPPVGTEGLIVVAGGGMRADGSFGRSTQERLDATLLVAGRSAALVLVAEYPAGRARMADYLVAAGLPADRIVDNRFSYDDRESGTVNNVRDGLTWLAAHPEVDGVVLVTSPYHQRRVDLIWRQEAAKLGMSIRPAFLPLPDGGEIMTCSRCRFWKLIIHETGGILHRCLFN